MISFSSARVFLGALSRQPIFLKKCLTSVNPRFAFLHSSKILWDGHKMEIKMPALSPTMTEGTIIKWLKKEGDTISAGDVLCEIQTDKAVVGLETEEEGVLEKILIPEDTQNVQLGVIIAIIMGEGSSDTVESVSTTTISKDSDVDKNRDLPKEIKVDATRLIGPSVKKLLEEYNIEYLGISTSGPHHNILKGDVLSYIKSHNLKQVATHEPQKPKPQRSMDSKPLHKGAHLDIPLSAIKLATAHQLFQSKRTIPHGYMSADCKIDKALDLKNQFQKDGSDVSLNEFIIRSTAAALKKVPKINIFRHNGQLKSSDSINISITDFDEGQYVTSTVKNAGALTLQLISQHLKASKTNIENLQSVDGMFKISNLATSGISEFIEVISPTDVAIMAIGGIRCAFDHEKPVKKLKVTLSYDNSIVGEDEVGAFLDTFKQCLENPLNVLCSE